MSPWPSRADIGPTGLDHTESGIPIPSHFDGATVPAPPPAGVFPFTRGLRADGYRRRPWTFRQYAGFGDVNATNDRLRMLVEQGQTGLSVALDLPTQMGLDSDDEAARYEVGRIGVAIDSIDDMERTFRGIDLSTISTSFTINATAPILLALYVVAADRQGVARAKIRGTVQNDILKEFVARGAYLYPPAPSMRLACDVVEYCVNELPGFNPMSICAAHMRSAGATPVQSDGLMFAHAVAYCDALLARGLTFDSFAPRLSFLTSAYRDLFESAARFRACRMVWADLARERFGATQARSMQFRVHSGGDVDGMTIEEPLNNVARMTLNALAAALGGCQSMQLPCYDEAYEIPSEEAILNGLRVQQIVALESGVCRTPDPLGGSYLVEHLTAEIAERIRSIVEEISSEGGALAWVESGRTNELILREARAWESRLADGREPRVGSNVLRSDHPVAAPALHQPDRGTVKRQALRVAQWRTTRDVVSVESALAGLARDASSDSNVMPALVRAADVGATVGEMHDVFRRTFGPYQAPSGL